MNNSGSDLKIFKRNESLKMNAIKRISENSKSAREYNIKLDDYLRTTPVITEEILMALDEAYGYNAATTASWVISKLRILHTRLLNKEKIEVTDNAPLKSTEDLKKLVVARYPSIVNEIFTEKS